MSIYSICLDIYDKSGQWAVVEYCQRIEWQAWNECQYCECIAPIESQACLICGSTIE